MATAPKQSPAHEWIHGALRIVRHGRGPGSAYAVTFRGADSSGPPPHALSVASSDDLVYLLENLKVDFHLPEVREALETVLRHGDGLIANAVVSANGVRDSGLA